LHCANSNKCKNIQAVAATTVASRLRKPHLQIPSLDLPSLCRHCLSPCFSPRCSHRICASTTPNVVDPLTQRINLQPPCRSSAPNPNRAYTCARDQSRTQPLVLSPHPGSTAWASSTCIRKVSIAMNAVSLEVSANHKFHQGRCVHGHLRAEPASVQ